MLVRPVCVLGAGEVDVDGDLDGLAADLALELDRAAGGALEAAEDDDGLAGEEVGDPRGADLLDAEAAPVDLDVGEHGAIDLPIEAIDDGLGGLARGPCR
jgi:hypothetical protein